MLSGTYDVLVVRTSVVPSLFFTSTSQARRKVLFLGPLNSDGLKEVLYKALHNLIYSGILVRNELAELSNRKSETLSAEPYRYTAKTRDLFV